MNKVTTISQRTGVSTFASPTSPRHNQSFVKELAKPTHNRLTTKPEDDHRTDNRVGGPAAK